MEIKKPVGALTQRYPLWKEQELVLFEDELKVCYRSGPNLSRRTVPLEIFDTNESEGRVFPLLPRRGFAAAVVAAVALFGMAAAFRLETGALPAWALWAGGASAVLAAAFAAAHVLFSYDAAHLYHAYTGEFLCAVLIGRGSGFSAREREEAREFLARLKDLAKRRTERARAEGERPSIARELKALHELREKKVISDEEFGVKKAELVDEIMRE